MINPIIYFSLNKEMRAQLRWLLQISNKPNNLILVIRFYIAVVLEEKTFVVVERELNTLNSEAPQWSSTTVLSLIRGKNTATWGYHAT